MLNNNIVELLSSISLALFRKNFFGIYHGSISSKVDHNTFVINTKEAIFDEIDLAHLCQLTMNTCDYSWKLASIESNIHNSIYNDIHEAKYIACGMPPYTTAYSLKHNIIKMEDYYGKTLFGEIIVYDAGDFDTWYGRNSAEITKYLKQSKNHIMVIRGVGVYVYDRDMNELIKKVAILENSCRLLALQ